MTTVRCNVCGASNDWAQQHCTRCRKPLFVPPTTGDTVPLLEAQAQSQLQVALPSPSLGLRLTRLHTCILVSGVTLAMIAFLQYYPANAGQAVQAILFLGMCLTVRNVLLRQHAKAARSTVLSAIAAYGCVSQNYLFGAITLIGVFMLTQFLSGFVFLAKRMTP